MTDTRASRLHRDTADQIAAVPSIEHGSERELMANEPSTADQSLATNDQLAVEAIKALQFITDVARAMPGFSQMAIKQADAALIRADEHDRHGRSMRDHDALGALQYAHESELEMQRVIDQLDQENLLMSEGLNEAADAIEGKTAGLDDAMCCSGQMCGCYGSSNRDWLVYNLRHLAKRKGTPA